MKPSLHVRFATELTTTPVYSITPLEVTAVPELLIEEGRSPSSAGSQAVEKNHTHLAQQVKVPLTSRLSITGSVKAYIVVMYSG